MTAIQRFRLALLVELLVLLVGVAGYALLERWNLFDSLYMTVITLATIGYGEVNRLTTAGRGFTIGLILAGLVSGAFVAGSFAEVVLGNLLRETLERRRMEQELKRIANHTLICGWGRMGQEIGGQLRAKQMPFVVVETGPEKCRQLQEAGILHVQGDASDDQVLRRAGVERARSLVAVAPKDADNIFITLSARSLNKELFIVARSVYEQDVHKLELAGANRVVSPYVIGARRIAAAIFHPAVVDFLDLEDLHERPEWELEDLPILRTSAFAGKSLRDCGIREESGCTVLAIREAGTGQFNTNPDPNTAVHVGDTLVVLGTREQLARLNRLAGVPEEEHSAQRLRRRQSPQRTP